MKCVNSLVAVALALVCSTVQAGLLTNPGFEGSDGKGSLAGWDTSLAGGGANFVDTFSNKDNPAPTPQYQAWSGKYFLQIGTGSGSQDVWRKVTQSIDLLKGQTLSGAAAFAWGDLSPYMDGARVMITGANNYISNPLPFSMSGNDFTDDYANGSWTPWFWTAPWDGKYTLEYGVANTVYPGYDFDTSGSSYGLFDMKVSAVPEPVTLALYVIGLASLSVMQRRRTASQCRSA